MELTGKRQLVLRRMIFFLFSSNAVRLGSYRNKRKRGSIKTFFSSCAYTLYLNAFSSEDTGLEKHLQVFLSTSSSYIFLA